MRSQMHTCIIEQLVELCEGYELAWCEVQGQGENAGLKAMNNSLTLHGRLGLLSYAIARWSLMSVFFCR